VARSRYVSKAARIAELWRRGITHWKLYGDQKELYDELIRFLADPSTVYGEYYVDICRQFGKTFTGLLLADQFARVCPNRRVLYTCPTRAALWQFLQPNMSTILHDCPAELRPRWNTTENSYLYANGSVIHLAGLNSNHEDDARGPKADLIVNEEAAFVDRLKYVIEAIERPMLMTTGGRIIHISTPPESPDHHISTVREACEAKGRYIKRTLDDVTHLSSRTKEHLIEEAGGRNSTTVRRELFCEWIVERERAIVPEFADARERIVEERSRPRYWDAYEVMDPGYSPSTTAVLFGYYDFKKALYVIEDELIVSRMRTDMLAEALREKEAVLWPEKMRERNPEDRENLRRRLGPDVHEETIRFYCEVKYRWSDIIPVWLNDLASMHGISFAQTAKDDLDAQINKLRIWTKQAKYRIHPRCKNLIAQLAGGVWNKARTDFELSPTHGHYDAVSALIYGVRNCPVTHNPYPVLSEDIRNETHLVMPWAYERAAAQGTEAARKIFGGLYGNRH
jgi:hypothetical protein